MGKNFLQWSMALAEEPPQITQVTSEELELDEIILQAFEDYGAGENNKCLG